MATQPHGTAKKKPVKKDAPKETERDFGRSVWEWTKSLFIGFLLFLVIRTFVIQTWTVISGSMEGTLLVGDFLVLSKSAYGATIPGTGVTLPGYSAPELGDIVVFRGHHEPIDLVKRLVGIPGDTLEMRDGVLFRNGEPQNEPYAAHTDPANDGFHPWMEWQLEYLTDPSRAARYRPTRDTWGPIAIPPGHYFVMGDNRDQSLDSRYWGFVPESSIKGKAVMLYFSWDRHAAGIPLVGHVRWGRVGDRIR